MEELLLSLETSSQMSVDGMDASVESTPVDATLVTAVCSSRSDSPIKELQLQVNLALNSLFTAKRMSELERQSAIRDFETSFCQCEADAMATIEKAKAAHSGRDLHARVKCTKAIMKVKLDYHMTIQEARTARCAELQESEVAYSEALGEAEAKKAHECATLHQMYVEHMQDLEAQAIRAENRSCQDFLLAHQMLLHQASRSVKEESYSSYSLLLGPRYSPFLQHVPFTPVTSVKLGTRQSSPPKRQHSSEEIQEDMSGDEAFLLSHRKNIQIQNEGRWATGKPP